MAKVIHIENEEQFDEIIKGDKPAMIDFSATWCGPCQMAAPIIDAIAETYKNTDKVAIAKIDIDGVRKVATEYDVMSVPTFVYFKNGKEVSRVTGLRSQDEIEDTLDSLI